MKPVDRDILHDYYGEKLKTYCHDTRSLGWIPGARKVRFEALTSIGDLNNSSVLDVGCGFGDLYGYLVGRGIKVDYTGVDINPDCFIRNTLNKMFGVCNRGLAADFLSLSTYAGDAYWHCPPEDVLKFCRGLSKRVVLRADYMSGEYCVYIYKNELADERNIFEKPVFVE